MWVPQAPPQGHNVHGRTLTGSRQISPGGGGKKGGGGGCSVKGQGIVWAPVAPVTGKAPPARSAGTRSGRSASPAGRPAAPRLAAGGTLAACSCRRARPTQAVDELLAPASDTLLQRESIMPQKYHARNISYHTDAIKASCQKKYIMLKKYCENITLSHYPERSLQFTGIRAALAHKPCVVHLLMSIHRAVSDRYRVKTHPGWSEGVA